MKTGPTIKLIAGMTVLVSQAACNDVVTAGLKGTSCEQLTYADRLDAGIDEIQVWAGNRAVMAASPLLTTDDPQRIANISAFFLARTDGWYVAAGETYDPDSRRSGSEFTVKFLSDGRALAYVGWGYNYLETSGCETETVRVLSPPSRPELHHLIFETPLPR